VAGDLNARGHPLTRWIATVSILLIIAMAIAAAMLYTDVRAFGSRALHLPAEGVDLEVAKGSSVRRLAEDLDSRGYLDRPAFYLELLARLDGVANLIRAGEYRVLQGSTPWGLLQQLLGGRVVQYSLTLIEGWSFNEMMRAVHDAPTLVHTLKGVGTADLMARIGAEGEHPEGRFLPDTYHFPKGTTDVEFLRRARSAMQELIAEEWPQRAENLPLLEPHDAITLASIIEKETGLAEERGQISGVFIRRLRRGMRLQTDPTVIYGLGEDFDGNLRRADLRADTPYNTYTRVGLPPTPIAMPGRDAIRAALHPEDGETLYFVAKGDGSHQFSKNLSEHNRAVRTYQLKK